MLQYQRILLCIPLLGYPIRILEPPILFMNEKEKGWITYKFNNLSWLSRNALNLKL